MFLALVSTFAGTTPAGAIMLMPLRQWIFVVPMRLIALKQVFILVHVSEGIHYEPKSSSRSL